LEAGQQQGKKLKIHAEQLSLMGAAELAASLGALSADHLEYLDEGGVKQMAAHGTVATLLPGAFYFLRERQLPPIELLRRYQVPMAVATDFNPGSSPVGSLPLAGNLAITLFGLTPAEALLGMTRYAAQALGWQHELGTIAVGKTARLVLWECDRVEAIVYGVGLPIPNCRFLPQGTRGPDEQ
jgi:imidazolonepropionase